ncbi:hypothetical protein Zmor_021536 [Zophobas morio]|uniref:Uncharacterized protein n=1 Tax=Zophobas morio TaxID=2755281 RepID=A0AA38I6C0_9CUCU|nr:hypothetical protein Zmor_021536 [Zophobas morio]
MRVDEIKNLRRHNNTLIPIYIIITMQYDDIVPEDGPQPDMVFDGVVPDAGDLTHRPSLDSVFDISPMKKTNEILVEKMLQGLSEIDFSIQRKTEALENLDVTIQIVNYKIGEATQEFKTKIGEMQNQRSRLLSSIDNKSELSLIINDLDKKISDLEKELDYKSKSFRQEKIAFQQQAEALMFQLDEDAELMEDRLKDLKAELDVQMGTLYRAHVVLINQKFTPMIEQLEQHLLYYQKLKQTEWKVEHTDMKLTEILQDKGIEVTPSGKLLTRTGSVMTFGEAQEKGYFKEVSISLDKILQFFKEREQQQQAIDQIGPPDVSISSEASTTESKMSTEDVKYLKQYVGKPLTLALAEITAKQPRDPIHYLGHYLFKYRYNQELEEVRKREIDELTEERKVLAEERWKRFVEEEARNAVMDMIIRAENIALQNELKRIEEQQLRALEEEEGFYSSEHNTILDEAKD